MAIVPTTDPFNTQKAQSSLNAGKALIASMPAGATSSAMQSPVAQTKAPVVTTPKVNIPSSSLTPVNGMINGIPVAEYNRLDNLYKTPKVTPSSTVGSTLTTSNTNTPPAVTLPTSTVPTQGATLSADVNTQAQNYANTIVDANKLATDKANLDTTAKSIADYISGRSGETALTNAEYQTNVDPKKVELDEITNQLNQETLAGRRRVEAVLNIPGITKEQAQDKINEIERVNTSKQADLAIIYQAKNGAYETAKEIADRKVSALLEVEKNKLDALQFTYTNNKELFNKQEQRQFETAQAERTRLLNEKSAELKAINDLAINALQNGASTSVVQKMQNAKTQAEAISYGGQFVGALDRQVKQSQIAENNAQIRKLQAEAVANLGSYGQLDEKTANAVASSPDYKTIGGLLPAVTAIKAYKDAVSNSGAFEMWSAKKKGELKSAYGNAISAWKTLAGLGALSGADFGLAENVIPEPSLFARNATVQATLDSALNNAITTSEGLTQRIGGLYPKARPLIESQLNDVRIRAFGSDISNEELLNSIPTGGSSSNSSTNKDFFTNLSK